MDVLRGFALLGIAIVNHAQGSAPLQAIAADLGLWKEGVDRIAVFFIQWLAEGKFYPLFSFLFGLGFGLQMERIEGRGLGFSGLYVRRQIVLLLLGLVHAFLIWYGDILTLYAVLGLLLLWLFQRRHPRTLLVWAAVCLLIPILLVGALTAAVELGRSVPEARAELDQSFAQQAAGARTEAAEATRVYSSGSYWEVTGQRARDVAYLLSVYPFFAPTVLGLLLLGLYAARRGFLADPPAHEGLIRRLFAWGLPLGLSLNLVYALASQNSVRSQPSILGLIGETAWGIGGPLLALAYAAGLVLLWRRSPPWRARLRPVELAGRMALTNYLLQSVLAVLFYHGYGLGMYGRVGPAGGLLLVAAIYAFELAFSTWWLARFRFGPVEWVWRSLTYGAPQPMRIAGAPLPASSG